MCVCVCVPVCVCVCASMWVGEGERRFCSRLDDCKRLQQFGNIAHTPSKTLKKVALWCVMQVIQSPRFGVHW